MLAAGRSNQAIARELAVTLDAANRTEGVARARELSLIP